MIDMRKILKKTVTLMMTAVIGVSMSCPKMIVYAGHMESWNHPEGVQSYRKRRLIWR